MERDISAYFQDIHDACCVIEDVMHGIEGGQLC
jgi:hypothetical protein